MFSSVCCWRRLQVFSELGKSALLPLWALVAATLPAQQLPIRNYTTTDGLPHQTINCIVRDSRDLLWFCTNGGLSRFDGYEFTNYTTNEGLPSGRVDAFLETRAG